MESITLNSIQILSGHRGSISRIKFDPSGQWIASVGPDRDIKIWGVESGMHQNTMTGHKQGISDVNWSNDSRLLATASDDRTVRIWDFLSGRCIRTFYEHDGYVFCCAFNAQSYLIASGSSDEHARIWDFRMSRVHRTIQAHSDIVTSVEFSYDSNVLMTSSYDGLCRMWSVGDGICLKTLVDDSLIPLSQSTFSRNGVMVLISSLKSEHKIWDAKKGKIMRTFTGHVNENFPLGCCFGYDNKLLISGSEDGDVCIWNINSTELLCKSKAHDQPVVSLHVHKDGSLMATGSLAPDCNLKFWQIQVK